MDNKQINIWLNIQHFSFQRPYLIESQKPSSMNNLPKTSETEGILDMNILCKQTLQENKEA